MEEITNVFNNICQHLNNSQHTDDHSQITNFYLEATNSTKILRNNCAHSQEVQDCISRLPDFFSIIQNVLNLEQNIPNNESDEAKESLVKMTWQLLANLCVQNTKTQAKVWENLGELLTLKLENISKYTDVQLMILYNIYQGKAVSMNDNNIFKTLVNLWEQFIKDENCKNLEFLQIFLEYFLTQYKRIITLYGPLKDEDRLLILQFLSSYIRNDSPNGPIEKSLLEYISKEFKKKSDCVLKTVNSYLDNIQPREVLALLDVISTASGSEAYSQVFFNDNSLFLNIGALLQSLVSMGKKPGNIFTPMQKLEQVAPNSNIDTEFEKEISFELKTMLVRALANLVYRNKKNQDYAREMSIIMAILDCTSVDARNPLVKEWSILAVRNLCENCPENQEIIRDLCKIDDAPNEILRELNLQMGSLRIRPNA